MRIVFLLPARSSVPIGGFVVVYEYANRLTERGHEVFVIHPRTIARPAGPGERLRADLWVRRYRRRPERLAPWFRLRPGVRLLAARHPGDGGFPDADALVATTFETAGCVAAATTSQRRGFYLIQGYDIWFGGVEEVRATWRLPLHKIVISRWLEEMAIEMGEGPRTTRVPIGLDFDRWGIDAPPQSRPPRVGAVLSSRKGEGDVLDALATARARVPALTAICFGTEPRPRQLPEWIEYTRTPSPAALRRLYNSCAVFLQASREEGWGLPAMEAMACGCALATYDTGGSREFALDRETALVLRPPEAERLGAAAAELLADPELRLDLVRRGAERVAAFTWPRAAAEFERAISGAPIEGSAPA